jgi:hypothetical protein
VDHIGGGPWVLGNQKYAAYIAKKEKPRKEFRSLPGGQLKSNICLACEIGYNALARFRRKLKAKGPEPFIKVRADYLHTISLINRVLKEASKGSA